MKSIPKLRSYFDVEQKKIEIIQLENDMSKEDFWKDSKNSEIVVTRMKELKKIINIIDNLEKEFLDKKELLEILKSNQDQEIIEIFNNEINETKQKLKELKLNIILDGQYDNNNCLLEIHSGAGGVEACDWAGMLLRMYLRWCEKNNYKYEEIDLQKGEEAGIKSASILVKGGNAFGFLKGENGVHRLVRLSPFDSNKRRHTSFASVDITPEINNEINVELKEEDLKIDVYRSGGAGGQSVNTTDSAVRITHLPTKIVVTCQNERSQIKNKEKAMQILKTKIYLLEKSAADDKLKELKESKNKIDFGSQIRSYVVHPYSMVKDHRTDVETSDFYGVLDGDINQFLISYLEGKAHEKNI